MTNPVYVSTDSQLAVIRLRDSLDALSNRTNNSDGSVILSEAMSLFKDYFDNLSEAEFKPIELKTGDTPRSEDYNNNLRAIFNDINRFYKEINNLSSSNLKSYNFSQIVINEIKQRASEVSSIVLDLNILNNFTRGDVIIAGEDFNNLDNADKSAVTSSSRAELLSGGSGITLARSGSEVLTDDPRIKVEIIPISPTSSSSAVNTAPTPGNFNRFYEGDYYNLLGFARPEGGKFNIRYVMANNPASTNPSEDLVDIQDPNDPAAVNNAGLQGLFLDYGASEEDKAANRRKMFDNNPDTFWECEYVVKLNNPLIPDVSTANVTTDSEQVDGETVGSDSISGATIQIDSSQLNSVAAAEDSLDLIIDIVITFPRTTTINLVNINPVLFDKSAYPEILDIATTDNTGIFTTVDGWETIRFPKSLTPEANEFLTDSQLSATLSPSRSNYLGQGVFPFPLRSCNKVKIRIKSSLPVAQVYEKTYVLLNNTLDLDITTTTTTKKGLLR